MPKIKLRIDPDVSVWFRLDAQHPRCGAAVSRLHAIAGDRPPQDRVTSCLVADPVATDVRGTPIETVRVTIWVPAADVQRGLQPFFADADVLAVAAATPHFAAMADENTLTAFIEASARFGTV